MSRFSIVFFALFIPAVVFGQYKSQAKLPDMSKALTQPQTTNLLGFIDFSRLHFSHSFSSSFAMGGGNSMLLNSYIGTVDYQFNMPLFLRLNLGVMNSPYQSFSDDRSPIGDFNNTRFFGSAELLYKPTDNTSLHLGVSYLPTYSAYGYPGYSGYGYGPTLNGWRGW
ncbi:MAG TPA: hypothetical protein PKV71_08940 [Calditrichia bacterium]|nr:hypothetical protein [Calditrichota bacterium]HQU72008.1 hypothetical protein [Calditrichia bacterium]HQV31989.1 hypothetical protein [Calditrichia bacterium]